MIIPLNQGKHPNLMHISLNKREHPMIKLPLNNREHPQTLLLLSLTNIEKGTQLSMVMTTMTTTSYLHHQLVIYAQHIHRQLDTYAQHIAWIWSN